jgi:DNA repair protein RadC
MDDFMHDQADSTAETLAAVRMTDYPTQERPREHLAQHGADNCSNAQLLAILLRTGTKGRNVLHVAEEMLNRFRSLDELSRASIEQLCTIPGVGRDKSVTLLAAFQLAQRIAREKRLEQPLLDTPAKVADLLRAENASRQVEQFQVALLNVRRRLIRLDKLSQGTLDTLLVHPREVFRNAILANAAAIVLVHNHPSGDPTPSEADIKVTRDLIRAGQLLKIEVMDHIILGRRSDERAQDYVSLRELGYFA